MVLSIMALFLVTIFFSFSALAHCFRVSLPPVLPIVLSVQYSIYKSYNLILSIVKYSTMGTMRQAKALLWVV